MRRAKCTNLVHSSIVFTICRHPCKHYRHHACPFHCPLPGVSINLSSTKLFYLFLNFTHSRLSFVPGFCLSV